MRLVTIVIAAALAATSPAFAGGKGSSHTSAASASKAQSKADRQAAKAERHEAKAKASPPSIMADTYLGTETFTAPGGPTQRDAVVTVHEDGSLTGHFDVGEAAGRDVHRKDQHQDRRHQGQGQRRLQIQGRLHRHPCLPRPDCGSGDGFA